MLPTPLRIRRSSVVAAILLGTTLMPLPLRAEPEKRFGGGVVLTGDIPRGVARSGVRLRPLLRARNDPGLRPAFGLNWVTLDFPSASGRPDEIAGRLRLRPLLAGVSYTWITSQLSISPRVFGGYSFNRFRSEGGAPAASASNGFVGKVELQLFHDLTPRVGILGSIGYLVGRPEVAGRTLKVDDLRLQVGVAYAIY